MLCRLYLSIYLSIYLYIYLSIYLCLDWRPDLPVDQRVVWAPRAVCMLQEQSRRTFFLTFLYEVILTFVFSILISTFNYTDFHFSLQFAQKHYYIKHIYIWIFLWNRDKIYLLFHYSGLHCTLYLGRNSSTTYVITFYVSPRLDNILITIFPKL